MRAVFANIFYWAALTNPGDNSHERALAFSRSLRPEITVTTEELLDEYLAHFSAARPSVRIRAGDTVSALLQYPGVLVIPQSHESFLSGLDLYRARPDKGYSLTDCISVHVMRQRGLTDVLTNDRHFEQEGFRALFRFPA